MRPTDAALADLTRGAVPRHLRGKVGDDDLAQEVHVRVHEGPSGDRFAGRADAEVRQFLRKTLASVVTDLVRQFDSLKRGAARERSIDRALDGSSARIAAWLASDHTSPSQRAIRAELLCRLGEALATLPDDQRRAIELHHLQGLSLVATADAMGRTWTSVAGLLRRGLAALRERLEEPE